MTCRLVIPIAVIAATASLLLANATPPTTEETPADYSQTFTGADSPCGFDITFSAAGTVTVTTYFDNTGPDAENEKLKQFIETHQLSYPIMLVSGRDFKKAGRDYEFRGIPTLALIDRKGRLRQTWTGPDPDGIREIHNEIKKLVAER